MKKSLFIFFFLIQQIIIQLPSSAQLLMVGGNLNYNYPDKAITGIYAFGTGGNIELKYLGQPRFPVSLTVGFKYFFPDSNYLEKEKINQKGKEVGISYYVIPIMVNADMMFGEAEFKPFIGMGLGKFISIKKRTVANEVIHDETNSDFGFAPSIGAFIDFSKRTHLSIRFTYEYLLDAEKDLDDTSYFCVSIGLLFNTGK